MGGAETGTPVPVEPTLKYHPGMLGILTSGPKRVQGPYMVGSLTGAVSSQSVTEEFEGTLVTVESLLKYHSGHSGYLTSNRNPVQGQCLVGSLTGAVAS